jgi:hypothetical protein
MIGPQADFKVGTTFGVDVVVVLASGQPSDDQMRSGFRNAESTEVPGGVIAITLTRGVNACGIVNGDAAAMTMRSSIDEREGRGVAIASTPSVSQPCAGTADTDSAAGAAAGSALL